MQHREILTSTMFLPVVRVAEISLVDGGIPELDKEVVLEEVREEVRRLDGGKWTGLSRNRSRRRARLWRWFWSLYNHAWRKLEWPTDWQRACFMPLFKGAGS